MTRPALVLAAAVAVAAGQAAPAHSEEVTARGSVLAEYLYHLEKDASVFDGRVEIDAEAGPVLVGGVFRAYQLSDPSYNPVLKDIPPVEIKHRYAELRGESVSVRAGHFFATFGNGLSLRSYEDIDLEHDTVLDGVLATYDAGFGTVTALAGTAEEELTPSRERTHVIRGVSAVVARTGWLSVGGSAVERAWEDVDEDVALPDSVALFNDSVLAGQAEAWLGPLALSGEYAGRNGRSPATGRETVEGHATYASGTADLGWVTLFGEFKDYDDFSHLMVNPPTCVREHAWTLMNRATYEIDLDDERGFLAEGTAPLGEAVALTAGASEARRHDGELSHWEMFGEISHALGESVTGSFAAMRSREYLLGKFTEHAAGAGDIEIVFPSGFSVDLALEGGRTNDVTGFVYEDYVASLTWYPGSGVTVSHVFEATTSPIEDRDSWLMSEVRTMISDDLELAVAVGSERGGKKCAGGVCRFEPEFQGVRVRLNSFF